LLVYLEAVPRMSMELGIEEYVFVRYWTSIKIPLIQLFNCCFVAQQAKQKHP
jgi:hypothetical protein